MTGCFFCPNRVAFFRSILFRFAVLLGGLVPVALPAEEPEFRALWITRFEWPNASEAATKAAIQTMMQTLQAGHFNAVFFQVRALAETYYPSPEEPWSSFYNFTNPGWDPLAYAIEQAHARGLQFHAYLNTHVCWQGTTPPTYLGHLYYRHCNATHPYARDWLYHDSSGTPQANGEDNYVWMAPGVPDFQAYLRRQVLYIAQAYPIDGVHFDRIRVATPGSFDPISLARFSGDANPQGLDYQHWNAEQITRTLSDIYGAVAELNATRPPGKPRVAVSTSPVSWPDRAYSVYNQDVDSWLRLGANDFVCPQYFWSGDPSGYDNLLQQHVAKDYAGRLVVAGMSRQSAGSLSRIAQYVDVTRQAEFSSFIGGQIVFSWSRFPGGEIPQYATGDSTTSPVLAPIYPDVVPPKPFGFVETPTEAIIVGTVRGALGYPVVDAQLTYSTDPTHYVHLSSGDGFYSILRVPVTTPTLTLNCVKPNVDSASASVDSLTAGEVRRVDFVLPNVPTPTPTPVPPGDINGDLWVNAADQGLLIDYVLHRGPPLSSLQALRTDLNEDGATDAADAIQEATLVGP